LSVKLIKSIDKHIGLIVCNFLSVFNKKTPKGKINKILLIQLWGIGETILVLPSLTALRKKFPKAEINVLATNRNYDVFYNNKNINNIIKLNLDPFSILSFIFNNIGKYDLVVDFEEYLNISSIISFFTGNYRIGYSHNSRSKLYDEKVKYNDKQHCMQTFLDLVQKVGASYKDNKLVKLNYSINDKSIIDKFLKNKKIWEKDYLIGIAPGAAESAKSRMWPSEKYSELINTLLRTKKNKIILIGNEEEKTLIDKIIKNLKNKNRVLNTAGLFDLKAVFYLIEKCNLFVGNDAGPMHIAAAQGTKTVGLFGPNLPVRFGPYGKNNKVIYKGDNCQYSPCINVHKGQVPDCLYAKNSKDYQKCMKNINVDDVLRVV
jgi:heptosyltransferase-2